MADLPQEAPSVVVRGRRRPARCAVCHDDLAARWSTTCQRCGSAAHAECRAGLARCPTVACREEPSPARDRRPRSEWLPRPIELLILLAFSLPLLLAVFGRFDLYGGGTTFEASTQKLSTNITNGTGGPR